MAPTSTLHERERLEMENSNHSSALKGPVLSFFGGFLVFLLVMLSSEWLLTQLVNVNLRFVNGFLDIGFAIALILLYNTTYYTFMTTKNRRILMKSITFLSGGIFQILNFIFIIYANSTSGADVMRVSILLGNINLLLLFAALTISDTLIADVETKLERRSIIMGFAALAVVIFALISWAINVFVLRENSIAMLGSINTGISYMICILLVFKIILDMRSYYTTGNEDYAKMLSAYVFFFIGMIFSSFTSEYGQLSYFCAMVYQVIGIGLMLKYAYRIYVGDPLRNIQYREDQVQLYVKNIENVIKKKTQEVSSINDRFLVELEYARSIQQSLLPQRKMLIKNTHFVSEYFPCDKLSGDFFDIYKIDDENIGMYILDVSGHGISAALMTMFCNNYIRSTERLIMRFRGLKPHKNLAHFFEEFNKMNFPDEMHMVVFFASYNMTTKVLTYCSGGMNVVPFVVSTDGSLRYLEDSEGFAICKLNGIFTPEYRSATIQLKAGDRVVFSTDGLVDKEKNHVFSQPELEKMICDASHLSLKQLNEKLIASIYPYSGKLADDITYFIMEA